MNDHKLQALLEFYGHWSRPFGVPTSHPDLQTALQSYQAFHALPLERIGRGIFQLDTAATGELDAPTEKLLETARCACPDYAVSTAPAIGVGNWKSCHGIGQFHAAIVRFLNEPPPFLAPLMNTVWQRVVDAYAEIGLMLTRDDRSTHANIDVSFVKPDGGWIGLAIVGTGQGCGDRIWAKFDRNYQPTQLVEMWTTLMIHEFGHNCGLSHSNGGIMNPYLLAGLGATWRGDPSHPLLVSRFGGQPIPRVPTSRVLVTAWQYGPDDFEVIKVHDTTKTEGGIFQL